MMAGMITLILTGLLRGVRTQRSLVFENLALRHQLAVLQRNAPRPRLRTSVPAVLGPAVPPVERLDASIIVTAGWRRKFCLRAVPATFTLPVSVFASLRWDHSPVAPSGTVGPRWVPVVSKAHDAS
jgi:hypothetical protein